MEHASPHPLGSTTVPGLPAGFLPQPATLGARIPDLMPELDERELLSRAQTGDRDAFGQLVRLHERRVFACAVQMMGQTTEVDDVVQDVFVRAWRAISRFDGRSELSTWLYRICVNVCLNRFRSGKRGRTVVDAELAHRAIENATASVSRAGQSGTASAVVQEGVLEGHKNPLELMELRRLYERLGAALDGLPESLRTTVVLVLMQGVSHRQAAEVFGCSEGTVAWRIHEARRRLRASLAEESGHAPELKEKSAQGVTGGAS